jgi:POT family proton-dependent oligopeptide transporter
MATDIELQHTAVERHDTSEEKPPAVESEWANLRRVPDKLPKIALLILAVEVSAFEV